jgi:arylsulfatase A-like enzyme
MNRRPNFLFFITDQHRADHLGCYGNSMMKTPNIDKLAAAGTRFDRFYVATPICMPNRATLMTGRMPSLHGARQNGIPLSLTATTFVDILRAAGYDTALIGKCHLQSINGNPPVIGMPEENTDQTPPPEELSEADKSFMQHGRYDQELPSAWEREPDFEPTLPYYGFNHVELAIGHGDKAVGHYDRWLKARDPNADSLRGANNQLSGNSYVAPQAWRTRIPEELYPTTFVAERTIDYLEKYCRSEMSRPFFLQCSFPDPHHPFTPPGRYWDMYDPRSINLPSSFHSGEHPVPRHLQRLYEERTLNRSNRDGQRTFAVTEREAREAIALTYGMISMIDDWIGRIVERIQTLGLGSSTVIVFTSDHGDFMGDHELLLKGALHYRGLVRVPFIWSDPEVAAKNIVNSGLNGTIDIASTILDRAGLAAYNGIQGRSLLAAVQGHATGYDSMLIEEHQRRGYMGFQNNFRARSLITQDHRLTIYEGAEWGELYDFRQDPDESNNLWEISSSHEIRCDLTEKLVRKMMELTETSPLATHHGP